MTELKKKFYALKRKYYPARQRFSLPPKDGEARGVALEDGKRLSDYGLKDGATLEFKDLGPQVRGLRGGCHGALVRGVCVLGCGAGWRRRSMRARSTA